MAVAQPGIPVKPMTLFVNKAAMESDQHGNFTWGAAQAGLAAGIADAVREGIIPSSEVDDLVLIAAVWVNPSAHDEEEVFANQRQAAYEALSRGAASEPTVEQFLAAADNVANPFFRRG